MLVALLLSVSGPLWWLYLRTLSPTIPLEDGGEMIGPSFTLGINHPPGYPLYALAGKLASLMPLGDVAFRYDLFSAGAAALACGVAAAAAFALLRHGRAAPVGACWIAALLGGWLLGTTTNVWWQAVIAEKYALNLLLNAVIVAICAAGLTGALAPRRWAPLLGLAYGISAAHHGQTIYLGPAVALMLWWGTRALPRGQRPRALGWFALFVLLGLSIKLIYPPVRSATHPLFNWNTPDTWPRFGAYFSAQPYQYRILSWGPAEVVRRLWIHLVRYLPIQFGTPAALLAAWGLVAAASAQPRAALVLGAVAATGTLYCVNFMLEGIAIETYYLPVYMVLAMAAAWGAADGWRRLRARSRPVAAAALAALVIGGAWQVRDHGRGVDRSRHYFAYDFAHALLKSVEPNSLFIAYGDYDLFPLWYVHYVLGEQPGVVLINSNFLPAAWAKDEQRRVQFIYPKGSEAVAGKVPYAEDLVKGDPGLPVYFSVIYGAIEKAHLLPRGAAYQYVWDERKYRGADVLGEWARYKRWRTVRGISDEGVPKDSNTRTTLSYYAYADYRRGIVLDYQGRHEDAQRMYRTALRWPYFFGVGPAAAHASLAQGLLLLHHDNEGAIEEFRLATRANPEWLPAHRALGALYFSLHRYEEALAEFRTVRNLAPDDPAAAADVRRLELFVPAAGPH